ncbi:MAG: DUF1045 domain-containing protein [Alphaproteobacteria bacterium]|nr:DUF1045 domain-containing protein [Alphaproteobacteria bacterium]
MAAATRLGAETAGFPLPPLRVSTLGDFVAIREAHPSTSLRSLADRFVRDLDFARRPQTEEELARRRAASLSDRQDEMLARWGYAYVFDEWKFHFTLTAGLNPDERSRFVSAAHVHFADVLSVQRWVDNVAVFVQPAKNEPFTLVDRVPLASSVRR